MALNRFGFTTNHSLQYIHTNFMEGKDLVILFGATGRMGLRVAYLLLQEKIPTRLVVRSRSEIQKMFGEREREFESVIEIPDFLAPQGKRALQNAFKGSVTYTISALGQNFKGGQTDKIQYDIVKQIIDLSKRVNVKRFVLCSSALITKISHPFSFLLDVFTNVYEYKAKAENYLRKSGLNYAIVRPGGLKGQWDLTKYPPTNYMLAQGDNTGGGQVNRFTVAKLIVDSLRSKTLKNHVTFEVKSEQENLMNEEYVNPEHNFQKLREDTQNDIVTANHRLPRYITFGGLLTALGYFLFA